MSRSIKHDEQTQKQAQKRNIGALSAVLKYRQRHGTLQDMDVDREQEVGDCEQTKRPEQSLVSDQKEGEDFFTYLMRQPEGTKIVKVLGSEVPESGAASQKKQSLRSYMDELSSQGVKITSVKTS